MQETAQPEGESPAGYDPVLATIRLLDQTAAALERVMAHVEAGDFGKLDDLLKEQAALRRALTAAITERQHAQKIRHTAATDAGRDTLDLDGARAEVGRRLARLRATEGPDAGVDAAE
ncbi:hypothetical protein [Rhodobaculum claviforme]|uniref:Uncharacterized protein n=1 Tax=Rhodobaculum claviforme TaxID=1549854 RepID=A0A934TIV9_9RHOB|nr:hypothetical protein [Rhodobaculum claviforme]MBK5926022.1 hypothetical protein [Rhodobaculum claviforme]